MPPSSSIASRYLHLAASAISAGLILLGSARAGAQTATAPTSNAAAGSNASARGAAAEALFEEGVALSERGQLAAACAKFEASQSLDLAVGTLLYLADCYEKTGKLASAWARFREAASLAQAQTMTERAHVASVRAEALEPRLSRVVVVVPAGAAPGLSVMLDGTPVAAASWGSALPVDGGTIVLRVSAPGYEPFQRTLSVPNDSPARLRIEVPELRRAAVAPSANAPADKPTTGASPGRTFGLVAGVVGVSALAGAGVLAYLANARNDDSLAYCPDDPTLCTPRGVELRDEAARFADFATVSAVVGGTLVVTGIVFYVTSSSGTPQERVTLRVAPASNWQGASLQAGGRF